LLVTMSSEETRLAAVKARLYALPPEEFVAARNAEAERATGTLKRQIRALRRPTLAAWLVNLLAAHRETELAELLEIGDQLRDAQRTLEGQDMRELSTRRQVMITSLVGSLRDLAAGHGRRVREDTVWEAETTLRAALADPELATEVRAGTLVRSAEYSGLGLAPDGGSGTDHASVKSALVPGTSRRGRTRLRVIPGGRDVEAGKPRSEPDSSARRSAEAALAGAERELDQAITAERETHQRLSEVTTELDQLRLRERRLRTEQAELERERRRTQRRRQAAEHAVAQARRRLR
jgi:hypothetical protein